MQSYAILYAREGNHLENVQSIIELASEVKTFFEDQLNLLCVNGSWTKDFDKYCYSLIAQNLALKWTL